MNHEQAHWMLEAIQRQADALKRIAVAVEALAKAREKRQIQPGCPDKDGCHGSQRWCDECGDVSRLCSDAACSVHGNYNADGDR